MKRSTDRILTTHVGSLVRTREIIEGMKARTLGQPYDQHKLAEDVRDGVSEIVRIAALAEAHHLPVSLHTWGDGVALAASLHLSAALKNAIVMELDTTHNPLRTQILRAPPEMRGGLMTPPEGPGLGVELDPSALERFAFSGEEG